MSNSNDFLLYLVTFLLAAILFVPLFKRFGLGTVLGYLAGGSLVGPHGVNLVPNHEVFNKVSEFGIIMLLFIIGLELQPKKIWNMRKSLLGLGSLQVFSCTFVISLVLFAFFLDLKASLVIGFALSLSSTAFVLQTLNERKMLNTSVGQNSFSILLMQDLVAIPSLAIITLLTVASLTTGQSEKKLNWLLVTAVLVLLFLISKFLLNFLFQFIARTRNRELFTAVTLLVVLGVSWIMGYAGLSMALGAFFAGVLLSESEYNHELEANLMPFRGLLMGFFFIYVGMGVNYSLLKSSPFLILAYVICYLLIKLTFIYLACKFFKEKSEDARKISVYLSQGGEFAFVIFATSVQSSLISAELSEILTLTVTLSMILCPLLIYAEELY